ncbi:MAG: PhzF family phenazine biosynthesis protein [Candidatus Bathyarchaeia archaeon]
MSSLTFYLVDVFGQEKYAGNQLAVFVNAGNLSTTQMQKLANEMHFSETTFILGNDKYMGGYDVRIFTPTSEIPFAGHPTLGTAWVIKNFVADEKEDKVVLNLRVGQIPVSFENDGDQETLWMKQVPPVFGEIFATSRLAKVLQLKEEDFDPRFPIQEVSTGVPFIIVPLKTLDAAKRANVNIAHLREMASQVRGGILIFCAQTINGGTDLHVRVFVNLFGIPEDPATGSGNGCLAGYLSRYRYFGNDEIDATVEQGIELGRPSLLLLKAHKSGDSFQVEIGGRVFFVAEGKLA